MSNFDWEKFKEIISNKRYRALVTLGLYVIFFIFVASIFRIYNNKEIPATDNQSKKTPIESFCSLGNYEFSYSILINNVPNNITGKVFRKDIKFSFNNEEYYVKDDILYKYQDGYFTEPNIEQLYLYNITQICNYMTSGTVISKNEDYENGIVETKYSVPSKILDSSTTIEKNGYVSIFEKADDIYKVVIDFDNRVTTIEYFNKDKVVNFTNEYRDDLVIRGVE